MSAITQALKKLEGSIGNLEGSIVKFEGAMAGQQRDMFGAPIKKNGKAGGVKNALIAKRLDQAIEKVEDLLKEG